MAIRTEIETPYKIPMPAAYLRVHEVVGRVNIGNGVDRIEDCSVFVQVYASEEARRDGGQPLETRVIDAPWSVAVADDPIRAAYEHLAALRECEDGEAC